MHRRHLCLLLLLPLLFLTAPARAQLQTGNLYGQVTDKQGEALPGVTVTLSGNGHAKVAVTNVEGDFRFLGLAPGTYQLTAELEGFSTAEYQNIHIAIGRNTTIQVTITPAVEETIINPS